MTTRTEFGVERGEDCTCRTCRRNCMFMPGYLIPADLERMIPEGADPVQWAELHLLASPGATVMKDGEVFNIPTLVPARGENGYCHWFQNRRCAIHAVSPFGCAFFSCAQTKDKALYDVSVRLSEQGLRAIYQEGHDKWSLYVHLWHHLWDSGRRAASAEENRARMKEG